MTNDGGYCILRDTRKAPRSLQLTAPGELRFQGRLLPLYYQGIAWIDESDFRIVRLRTDLLAPLPDAHLEKLTAEIHFGDAQVAQTASSLWLPRDVMVTSEVSGHVFQEQHRYSDYRAYVVESKILPTAP